MLIDIFIYMTLAVYFESVIPSQYGSPKHPLFFLKPCIKPMKYVYLKFNAIFIYFGFMDKDSHRDNWFFQYFFSDSSSSSSSFFEQFRNENVSSEAEEEVINHMGDPYVNIHSLVKEYHSSSSSSIPSFLTSSLFKLLNILIEILNFMNFCGVFTKLNSTSNSSKVKRRAVDGLSLNLWPGQVTCLLGHNGNFSYSIFLQYIFMYTFDVL